MATTEQIDYQTNNPKATWPPPLDFVKSLFAIDLTHLPQSKIYAYYDDVTQSWKYSVNVSKNIES